MCWEAYTTGCVSRPEHLEQCHLRLDAYVFSVLHCCVTLVSALTAACLPLTTSDDCAQVIRDLLTPTTYVIVVEHDLAVLDYLSDFICCLYGKPGKAS